MRPGTAGDTNIFSVSELRTVGSSGGVTLVACGTPLDTRDQSAECENDAEALRLMRSYVTRRRALTCTFIRNRAIDCER
jgi:hypothetical protein